ncbi:MAG: DUF2752 domain-containing protein [Prolixibacteraceae bacterium]|nr:DUF2752 domain-containing protein [Prolixibacteraceae bacterium]
MTNKIINCGLLIVIMGLAVLFFVLDPAKYSIFPRCTFNSLTGYYCPGCGSQRAIHSLLHFDIAGVVHYNFLFLPAIFLIIYHYLRPVFNRIFDWKLPNIFYFKNTPWIILGVVVVFWISRNIPVFPFTELAPG